MGITCWRGFPCRPWPSCCRARRWARRWGARAIDPLTPVARAELVGARSTDLAAPWRRRRAGDRLLLLAGFSQGACLALEYLFAGLPLPRSAGGVHGLPRRCSGRQPTRRPCRRFARLSFRRRRRSVDSGLGFRRCGADRWAAVLRACGRVRSPGRGHEVSAAEIAHAGRDPR